MNNNGLSGPREILALYPRLTRIRKALLATRFASIPYRFLNKRIPENALVFELGCGQGILANFLKEAAPRRVVVGMDLSEPRIGVARSSIDNRTGIYFFVGDIAQLSVSGRAAAPDRPRIYITSQVLYLLTKDQTMAVMSAIGRRLRQQDVYWIVDYCRRPFHKFLFLMLESAVLTWIVKLGRRLSRTVPNLGSAVTEAFGKRSRAARVPRLSEWKSMLERAGLQGRAVVSDDRTVSPQIILQCTRGPYHMTDPGHPESGGHT